MTDLTAVLDQEPPQLRFLEAKRSRTRRNRGRPPGLCRGMARLSKERSRESAAAERKLQGARREAARLVDAVAKGEMTGRMVSAKLAEFEAAIDRQEARLARATEANVSPCIRLLLPSTRSSRLRRLVCTENLKTRT